MTGDPRDGSVGVDTGEDMFDTLLGILAIPALMIIGFVLLIRKIMAGRSVPSRDFSVRRRQFLSPREVEAFRMLAPIAANADLHVCPQASMDSFLKFEGEGGFRERGRYKARRSDFAFMDRAGNVVLVVEIDDASHRGREEHDSARDAVVKMAGIPTLRVPGGRLPQIGEMQRMLGEVLPRIVRGR